MTVAKVISGIGLLVMTVFILNAMIFGDFAGEGAWLTSHPWGQVSLVDLYVGFTIFSMWIVYRENSLPRSAIWVVLMMVMGSWTTALYTLWALFSGDGDWNRFFHGRRLNR